MTSLNPVYRIGWQVEEPLRIHHPELSAQERKQRALTLLKQVELEDPERIYQSYPHQISGGQRQRVMIAAAMICEPKLLIADEPTTALDVTVQAQIVKLLKRINQKKELPFCLFPHDLSLVRRLCSRVIVMKDGRIVEQGAMEDIFENPQQEYTQKLIAAIPRCVKKRIPDVAQKRRKHMADVILKAEHLKIGFFSERHSLFEKRKTQRSVKGSVLYDGERRSAGACG